MRTHCSVSSFTRGLPLWWKEDVLPGLLDLLTAVVIPFGVAAFGVLSAAATYILGRLVIVVVGALPWGLDQHTPLYLLHGKYLAADGWWVFSSESPSFAIVHGLLLMTTVIGAYAVTRRVCSLGRSVSLSP